MAACTVVLGNTACSGALHRVKCRFASTFQMLRGTLVLFAGLLTIVLLKRRLHIHHWLGMALIVAGAAIVGASSVIFDSNRRPRMEQPSHGTRQLHFLEARVDKR